MQPGVTPGAVYEFHAAKALSGTGPGINSPLTTTAHDTSGNGNHGTLTNFAGTTASGYDGTGMVGDPHRLMFAGDNDHVDAPNLQVASGAAFTYEAWITDTGPKAAASRWILREAGNSPIRFGLYTFDGSLRFITRNATSGSVQVIYGSTYSGDGLWHHVVGANDGSYMRLYIDGVERGTPVAPAAAAACLSTWLGAFTNSAECWVGGVAVTRIYPFGFSAANVAQNNAAGYLWDNPVNLCRPHFISGGILT